MTASEISCDACQRTIAAWGVPVLDAARRSGWLIADAVLCPDCSDAWAAALIERVPGVSHGLLWALAVVVAFWALVVWWWLA